MAGVMLNMELRPCYITGTRGDMTKALFHCWEQYRSEFKPLLVHGYDSSPNLKIDSFVVGIVELEDGRIWRILPDKIRFTDSAGRFNEYSWDEKKEE